MNAVIVGASAGVGRALAEELAGQGDDLFLIARDKRDLEVLAADLRLRHGVGVTALAADIVADAPDAVAAAIAKTFPAVDALFLIAGITDRNDHGVMEDAGLRLVVEANFLGVVRLTNALLPLCGSKTDIVAAGSVATIRPRGSNIVYGAAKLGLEHYLMAIRHGFGDGLGSVMVWRLGYIQTAMTFGQKMALPAASPRSVAKVMVGHLGRSGVRYFPAWWGLIALILKSLPWFIFKRLRI